MKFKLFSIVLYFMCLINQGQFNEYGENCLNSDDCVSRSIRDPLKCNDSMSRKDVVEEVVYPRSSVLLSGLPQTETIDNLMHYHPVCVCLNGMRRDDGMNRCVSPPGKECDEFRVPMKSCSKFAKCQLTSVTTGTCVCENDAIYVEATDECRLTHGAKRCKFYHDCDLRRSLICEKDICVCKYADTQIWNPKVEACAFIPGAKCVPHEYVGNPTCVENAECINETCHCLQGYQETTTNECKLAHNEICDKDSDCHPFFKCLDNICTCPEGEMYSDSTKKCYLLVERYCGSHASDSKECVAHAECVNEYCHCQSGYRDTPTKECKVVHGGFCDQYSDCHPFFTCFQNLCLCLEDELYSNVTENCHIPVGASCGLTKLSSNECVPNGECRDYECKCLNGYRNTSTNECKLDYNEICNNNSDCHPMFECNQNSCTCPVDEIYQNFTKKCHLPVGTSCDSFASKECVHHADCLNESCQCKQGYRETSSQECKIDYAGECINESDCHNMFTCLNNQCSCPDGQLYYDSTEKCHVLVDKPCNISATSKVECVVNANCTNETCQCSDRYRVTPSKECKLNHNETCSINLDCHPFFQCSNNSCACSVDKLYFNSTKKCHLPVGASCDNYETDENKCVPYASCRNGKCICDYGYEVGDKRTCHALFGYNCSSEVPCKSNYYLDECSQNPGVCKCMENYTHDFATQRCLGNLNENCRSNADCFNYAFCADDSKTCTCAHNLIPGWNGVTCYASYGQPCSNYTFKCYPEHFLNCDFNVSLCTCEIPANQTFDRERGYCVSLAGESCALADYYGIECVANSSCEIIGNSTKCVCNSGFSVDENKFCVPVSLNPSEFTRRGINLLLILCVLFILSLIIAFFQSSRVYFYVKQTLSSEVKIHSNKLVAANETTKKYLKNDIAVSLNGDVTTTGTTRVESEA